MKAQWLACTSALALTMLAAPAFAEATNDELEQRIEKLETQQQSTQGLRSRVSSLEGRADEVQWRFDNGRPRVSSGDGRFELALRARFHFDAAAFMEDPPPAAITSARDLASGAVVRRMQFGVEGKVFNDFLYELRMNFGGSNIEGGATLSTSTATVCIPDDPAPDPDCDATGSVISAASLNAPDSNVNLARVAYTGIPNIKINVGVIQPIFTAEDSTSSNEITFIERASIVNQVVGVYGGSDSRRGIEVTYQKEHSFYPGSNLLITGAWTGASTGTSRATDDGTQVLGRIAYRLWSDGTSNFQIGASGASLLNPNPGSAQFRERPEMRVDGNRLVDTGSMPIDGGHTYGFDGGLNLKNFFVSGEWYTMNVDRTTPGLGDAEFTGWYAMASWILTGESKGYSAASTGNSVAAFGQPVVVNPFSLKGGGLGAIEAAVRYSVLDLNDNEGVAGLATPVGGVRGGEQDVWTFGVNWYLNRNIRLMVNYLMVDVDRLSSSGADISRDLDIVGGRLQFAF